VSGVATSVTEKKAGFRIQNSEVRIQNGQAHVSRSILASGFMQLASAKTQLSRDAAPFDSKSMLFLQQYDSMGISFHGLLGIQISQGPSGAESPDAGNQHDRARSGFDRPSGDGAHHPHPALQFVVHVL
jgi:hypothetical protein